MRLTREERAARRTAFRQMNLADKADYLFTYYKLPITLAVLALALVLSGVYRQVTKKDVILYAAYLNLSVGEDLDAQLNEGFLSASGYDPRKTEVYRYRALYLSDNPSEENLQYAYTSNLKLLAAASAGQLDLALMNREAYDILSRNGYLMELPELLPASLSPVLEPYLTANGDTVNALEVSGLPLFQSAGFPETVFLGVVTNCPRLPAAVEYIGYLAEGSGT